MRHRLRGRARLCGLLGMPAVYFLDAVGASFLQLLCMFLAAVLHVVGSFLCSFFADAFSFFTWGLLCWFQVPRCIAGHSCLFAAALSECLAVVIVPQSDGASCCTLLLLTLRKSRRIHAATTERLLCNKLTTAQHPCYMLGLV